MSRSLNDILEQDESEIDGTLDSDMIETDTSVINPENFTEAVEGMCVECADQPGVLYCEQCMYGFFC